MVYKGESSTYKEIYKQKELWIMAPPSIGSSWLLQHFPSISRMQISRPVTVYIYVQHQSITCACAPFPHPGGIINLKRTKLSDSSTTTTTVLHYTTLPYYYRTHGNVCLHGQGSFRECTRRRHAALNRFYTTARIWGMPTIRVHHALLGLWPVLL
jgi:hypothetical protein